MPLRRPCRRVIATALIGATTTMNPADLRMWDNVFQTQLITTFNAGVLCTGKTGEKSQELRKIGGTKLLDMLGF
jgi:hypothetical protein